MRVRKTPRFESAARVSESEVVRGVLEYLNSLDETYAWRNNTGSLPNPKTRKWISFGCPGSPDVLCIWRGKFVGVECKSATGRLSPGQNAWGRRFSRCGGIYVVARAAQDVYMVLAALALGVPRPGGPAPVTVAVPPLSDEPPD